MTAFPKVMVVSAAPIRGVGATGITLANLFRGWPHDKIAQVCYGEDQPDEGICPTFRMITPRGRLTKKVRRCLKSISRKGSASTSVQSTADNSSLRHGFLSVYRDAAYFHLPGNFWSWVERFSPDVIYSNLGSIRVMRISLRIAKRCGVPLVPHFMDDWPCTIYGASPAYAIPKGILNRTLTSVLLRAPFGLAIGEDMADEFEKRYELPFSHLMNCVDGIQEYQEPDGAGGVVRFVYVGGLHLNRWESLLRVADALRRLGGEGIQATIDILSPQKDLDRYGAILNELSIVRKVATVDPKDVERLLVKYDVLVHVESFREEDSKYTRLSVSTKIPQYLAAGRPILGHGPGSLSSIRYIARCGAGVISGDDGPRSTLEACRALVQSPELRRRCGLAGRSAAVLNHSGEIQREKFARLLNSAVVMK